MADKAGIFLTPESAAILKKLGDKDLIRLKEAFRGIGKDFRQYMKLYFSTPGTARFDDLKEATKKAKARLYGTVYPILTASGDMAASFYDKAHSQNISLIGNTAAEFGSSSGIAQYHQYGTKNMSRRRILISDDRRDLRWKRIMNNYLIKLLKANGINTQEGIWQ